MRFDKRESKKSKSGYTWRVTFDYKDRYGKKQRYSKSGFPTKKAAQIHAAAVQNDLAQGLVVDNSVHTVDELFQQMVKLPGYSPNTINLYTDNYNKHILPVLGSTDIKDLHFPELQSFFTDMSGVGKSAVATTKTVLTGIGNLAVKSGYILSWPINLVQTSGVSHSRKKTGSSDYLSETDFKSLLNLVSHGKYEFTSGSKGMFLLLGYYLGLRIAEACALTWEDVDFQKRTIRINKQLTYTRLKVKDFYIRDITKTEKSNAVLPAPEPLMEALKEWRDYNPYPLILCTEEGRWLHPRNTGNTIRATAQKLGFDFHPHMLRHTYITNLVLAGTDLKTVADLARHTSAAISLQVYTETNDLRKAEAIARAFEDETPNILA
ncbi:tyrosine-type recombinase/integrase [uncultured Faecalibaculum sp.]|uniref:site-specific integrase n=1 Tax=uncultured Faecalibaculum sp. TaxID=1729681 RepID=UPI0025E0ABEB|nr:tyrosine-type recombinase/integrase [uncultured Faecalibaculum sp.]